MATMDESDSGLGEKLGKIATAGKEGSLRIEELVALKIAAEGGTKAVGLLSEYTKKYGVDLSIVSGQIGGFANAIALLNPLAQTEKELFSSLSDVLSFKLGTAFEKLTGLMTEAAGKAQEFQVQLLKLGQTTEFQKSIGEQAYVLAKLGISYDSLKQANISLIENYNASIRISERQSQRFEENRKALTQLMTINEKFGVSLDQTNKILNFTTTTLGEGTAGATQLSEQLQRFSEKTGQSANDVFTKFNESLDRFSVLTSERAIQSFQKLEMTAKRTGQGMGDIFNQLSKFDDIETGFQAGGQLNRLLSFMGGSFDTFAAISASDEERAQMLYQAISGVSDRFQQYGTEQAKRSMVRQLQEATGMNPRVIMGLLNKSTDLSKDLLDISKTAPVTEGYSDQELVAKVTALTTSEEFRTARDGLIEAGKAAQELAKTMREGERARTGQLVPVYEAIDKFILSPLYTKRTEDLKLAFGEFQKVAQQQVQGLFESPGKALGTAADTFTKAVDSFAKSANVTVKLEAPPEWKGKPAGNIIKSANELSSVFSGTPPTGP